jgi:hypothetical protein
MQFTHLHPTHLCTVSVLSSIIGLGLPSGLLTYNFSSRILVYISNLSTRSAFPAPFTLLDFITMNICIEERM